MTDKGVKVVKVSEAWEECIFGCGGEKEEERAKAKERRLHPDPAPPFRTPVHGVAFMGVRKATCRFCERLPAMASRPLRRTQDADSLQPDRESAGGSQ